MTRDKLVGRDRRARRAVRNAKSCRMNDHVGCVPKTKFFLLRSVANHAGKTQLCHPDIARGSSTQSNSEIKTTFGTRTWSV